LQFSTKELSKYISPLLPKDLVKYVPKGWQKIGQVILLRIHPILDNRVKREIGSVLLKEIPDIKSVLNHSGPAEGELRIPSIELLAGDVDTETSFIENKCKFSIDPSKIMFSPGNRNERKIITSKIGKNDYVLDMFAGIGQFTVPIGFHSKPVYIESIEKNPVAFSYLQKNIKNNNLEKIIDPKFGDCRNKSTKERFNRVLMGLIPMDFNEFLPTAIEAIKDEGIIFCHYIANDSDKYDKVINALENYEKNINLSIKEIRKVKKINQTSNHYVVEIEVEK